ncbi:MAG: GNAT family N-acetyltransferase [Opitutaceae bacterium]|jgi:GNAT superfamily N-acetyltransferase
MPTLPKWTLRPEDASDLDFLRGLYASTRENEEPIRRWPAAHRKKFLTLQHEAQDKHYRNQYANAERWIVCVSGHDAGRLIINTADGDIRIVDISLLPAHRGRGLGTAILKWVFGQASAAGATVSLSVLAGNPALRLYQRLGFKECPGGTPPYLQLKRETDVETRKN